jgi:flagellar P-ring protein precursor FlgI
MAPDGKIYAVAHAQLGKSNNKNSRADSNNSILLLSGALIEKNIEQGPAWEGGTIRLALDSYHVQTAGNVIARINRLYPGAASSGDLGDIIVKFPEGINPLEGLNKIYNLTVKVEAKAKVVIDQKTATIVMGDNIKISRVGINKKGLMIKIKEGGSSGTGSGGSKETPGSILLEESVTIGDLIKTLNQIGLSAEDIIDIIKAMHAAGALHGELVLL